MSLSRRILIGAAVLILLGIAFWFRQVYAIPPLQWQNARSSGDHLAYEFVQPSNEWQKTGRVEIRNVDSVAWTNIQVQMYPVVIFGGDTNPWRRCSSSSTVQRGEILAVSFIDCASPLPAGVHTVRIAGVRVDAREGFFEYRLEKGIVIDAEK